MFNCRRSRKVIFVPYPSRLNLHIRSCVYIPSVEGV